MTAKVLFVVLAALALTGCPPPQYPPRDPYGHPPPSPGWS
jgi:hypothetical protein